MPKLPAGQRRALGVLADCPAGCPEPLMLAHGFTVETLCGLVGAGLVAVTAPRMVAGGRPIEMTLITIAESGRVALERRN